MSEEAPVSYEVQDEIAIIILRRPDKLNCVNRAMR